MEIHFYQLQSTPLPKVVADLATRCLGQGWSVNVTAPGAVAQLDDALWSFDDEAFLPHGIAGSSRASDQDILVSDAPDAANKAEALIMTGMSVPDPDALKDYARVSILFEGRNPDELAQARTNWKTITSAGFTAKYWSQEDGPWKMKASSDAK